MRFGPGRAALLGALLTVVTGILTLEKVGEVLRFLSLPVLTIVSLMVITLIAESAGFFRVLAWRIAVAARGDGRRLFTYLFFTGTVTGALFTNDAAVLIFTPMVFRLVEEIQDDWKPSQKVVYYFAVLYVANLVGPLVISNPINLIVASWFDIGFAEYAAWMIGPALVSIVVTYVGMRIFFRSSIPTTYRIPQGEPARTERSPFNAACLAVLGLTLLGFFTEEWTGFPTVWVAASGAGLLLLLHVLLAKRSATEIVRGVGWDVIVFMVGIFIVDNALRAVGFTDIVGRFIAASTGAGESASHFVTGFTAAGCSAVMNNHPVAGTMALAISDIDMTTGAQRMHAYAALIGGDLGPKMLPIGSLAALLWFRILRSRGVEVSYWLYVRIGVPVTLIAILLSILALNVQHAFFG